jgi:hypothetical protein
MAAPAFAMGSEMARTTRAFRATAGLASGARARTTALEAVALLLSIITGAAACKPRSAGSVRAL